MTRCPVSLGDPRDFPKGQVAFIRACLADPKFKAVYRANRRGKSYTNPMDVRIDVRLPRPRRA